MCLILLSIIVREMYWTNFPQHLDDVCREILLECERIGQMGIANLQNSLHSSETKNHRLLFHIDFTLQKDLLLRRHIIIRWFRIDQFMIDLCEIQHRSIGFGFRTNGNSWKWNLPDWSRFFGEAYNHWTLVPFIVHIQDKSSATVNRENKCERPP